ncbi:methyltransferase [Mesorhizobium sp.]|uniref:methyltransferase n=1 Tax=Mesorhizobium sp. TaxID=1871066 RepID=UPI000FE604D4|nr:methyltransferase [Mesorhizobium sp.]RWK40016.1 MAG: methyltransferase [Mesorhizobium sp.]RWK66500.1 MAG: methyltransferase [Mesorhizobium sp.]RWK72100.1 MAG: methyltransferase [Mesorhizobium sp.]RWK77254.1 MAG: methyltransferase [Mesorhizobium sp.]RWL01335.1 MAG: methyltransferase [Mesorhizobium sp.]
MDERTAAAELQKLVNGFQVSQAICVAATLGIADHLKDGKRTSGELAALTNTNSQALYRLLRALASVGVFHEAEDRFFSLTPVGSALRSDVQHSVAPWAILAGRPYFRQAWSDLLHSVSTGENAFRHAHGKGVWEYRAEHPEESVIFDRAMTAMSRGVAAAVLAAYDFRRFSVVMDVAGGQGALLAEILRRNPGQRGILFDQPQVVAKAGPVFDAAGVADRCDIVAGDFFVSVPEGADAIVLKWILHDWDDDTNIRILKTCRRAMRPEGKLLVLESILAPPNEGAGAKFGDLNMLVMPGGQERTAEEFRSLLAASDFQVVNIVEAGPRISVIEAEPV